MTEIYANEMGIKLGDTGNVIAGNDRGKTGKVIKSLPREDKVIVEGINIKAHHKKGENGGIVRSEAPIHVSNVALGSNKPAKSTAKKTTTKKDADNAADDKKIAANTEDK